MNKKITLNEDSLEFLASSLTAYAHICRTMRQHEKAERAETVRNTIYAQHAESL